MLLTALTRDRLDGRLALAPIEPRRLSEVHAAVMSAGGRPARLADSFRERVEAAMERALDGGLRRRSADFVNSCLNILEEDLAELDRSQPIDPRFIRSLLIRREHAAA